MWCDGFEPDMVTAAMAGSGPEVSAPRNAITGALTVINGLHPGLDPVIWRGTRGDQWPVRTPAMTSRENSTQFSRPEKPCSGARNLAPGNTLAIFPCQAPAATPRTKR
jgi:hypothetical protein